MPRPTRIQYEDAFYHVMNRGRGRQTIFHDESYYKAFLQTLEEAYSRFDAVFHAYCLMSNHYHLLIQTPRANLDRIMRHINGVYTQRYNRIKKTDGPLLRGRYKAILVDKDGYLVQLSRYIHRNPIEVKGHKLNKLEDYPWSSYPAFINKAKAEPWLQRDLIYHMLGQRQRYAGYASYVMDGNGEDIKRFYNKGNIATILGEKSFRDGVLERKEEFKVNTEISAALKVRPSFDEIVEAVCKVTKSTKSQITERQAGRQGRNDSRKLAMYLCQQHGDLSLNEIAELFGVKSGSSVSWAISTVKRDMETYQRGVERVLVDLSYIK